MKKCAISLVLGKQKGGKRRDRKEEPWREEEREGSLEGGDSGVCGCAVCLT